MEKRLGHDAVDVEDDCEITELLSADVRLSSPSGETLLVSRSEFAGTAELEVGGTVFVFSEGRHFAVGDPAPRPGGQPLAEQLASDASSSASTHEPEQTGAEATASPGREAYESDRDGVFVNPYTFVRSPRSKERKDTEIRRAGPSQAFDRPESLSGTVTVEWQAESPVLCSAVSAHDPDGPVGTFASDGESRVIPGSSLKGAIRSLHEALTASCYRIIDLDFVPSYRQKWDPEQNQDPKPPNDGWQLGKVHRVSPNGAIESVLLQNERLKVRPTDFLGAGDTIVSGDLVDITFDDPEQEQPADDHVNYGRDKVPVFAGSVVDKDSPRAPSAWSILVNRSLDKKGSDYWCSIATFDSAKEILVSDEARSRFEVARAGADGGRPQTEEDRERNLPVKHAQLTECGVRAEARNPWKPFEPGDIVWVKATPPNLPPSISELALSEVWREPGGGQAKTRLIDKTSDVPCDDPKQLCPACRIFGMADDRADPESGNQRSYAGRIRIGNAKFTSGELYGPVALAPLSSPRPGYSLFYLDRGKSWNTANQARIRGRKFYWHAPPDTQSHRLPKNHTRHLERPGGEGGDGMRRRAFLAPKASVFRTEIRFRGLMQEELGALIAAIDPQRVLEKWIPPGAFEPGDKRILTRLGGGKPLGLGSVTPQIVESKIESTKTRYLGEEDSTPDLNDCVASFIESVPEAIRDASWPDLAAVLNPGFVPADAVWYPPARRWGDWHGNSPMEHFDKSYEFFKDNDQSLPAARESTQVLQIANQVRREVD